MTPELSTTESWSNFLRVTQLINARGRIQIQNSQSPEPASNPGCFSWVWMRTLGWTLESTSQSKTHKEQRKGAMNMAPAWEQIPGTVIWQTVCPVQRKKCAETDPAQVGGAHLVRKQQQFTLRLSKLILALGSSETPVRWFHPYIHSFSQQSPVLHPHPIPDPLPTEED